VLRVLSSRGGRGVEYSFSPGVRERICIRGRQSRRILGNRHHSAARPAAELSP